MKPLWLVLPVLVALGCSDPVEPIAVPAPTPPKSPALAARYDPECCGGVAGRATWLGPVPRPPAIVAPRKPGDYFDRSRPTPWPNPHTPDTDPRTGGLRDAVVFLRGIDPERSRPWDHPPVRVEIDDARMRVVQGDRRDLAGFVRRGDAVEFVSREPLLHLVQARGVEFFSQPLTQPEVVRRRTFARPGHVELSSGAGYFWMRAHLLVVDHPYYTRTDYRGDFRFEQVPPGEYEVVVWLPNWREVDHDLNADTGYRTSTRFAEPSTHTRRVRVYAGETAEVPLAVFAE